MGIKKLSTLFKRHIKKGIKEVELSTFASKILAIDISTYLYQLLYNDNLYNGLIRQCILLMQNNITPIYIFDGRPTKAKIENTIIKRKEKQKENEEKVEELKEQINTLAINEEEQINTSTIIEEENNNKKQIEDKLNKMQKTVSCVPTREHILKCQEMFKCLGIPYIEARGEADILCGKLCKEGIVDGVISEDYDMTTFGCNIFIRGIFNKVTVYNLEEILQELELTYTQYVDMCILAGCDYTTTIQRIAIIGAYENIKKYKTIEKIIETIDKKRIPDTFDYNNARNIFLHCSQNEEDIKRCDIKLKEINYIALTNFMQDNNIYSKITIDKLKKCGKDNIIF